METGVSTVQAMEISIRMRYAAISMRASVLFMTSATLPPVGGAVLALHQQCMDDDLVIQNSVLPSLTHP